MNVCFLGYCVNINFEVMPAPFTFFVKFFFIFLKVCISRKSSASAITNITEESLS